MGTKEFLKLSLCLNLWEFYFTYVQTQTDGKLKILYFFKLLTHTNTHRHTKRSNKHCIDFLTSASTKLNTNEKQFVFACQNYSNTTCIVSNVIIIFTECLPKS